MGDRIWNIGPIRHGGDANTVNPCPVDPRPVDGRAVGVTVAVRVVVRVGDAVHDGAPVTCCRTR